MTNLCHTGMQHTCIRCMQAYINTNLCIFHTWNASNLRLPPRQASRTSQLPNRDVTPDVSVLTEDPCFASFAGILGEPGAVEATCQQLLSRLRGGNSIRWEELVNMNPTITLLELGLASSPTKKAVKIANQEEVGMLGGKGWGGN